MNTAAKKLPMKKTDRFITLNSFGAYSPCLLLGGVKREEKSSGSAAEA
jgi:hypothetical protein